MNKQNILSILLISALATITLTSCADEENSSEATVSYIGQCNEINYFDQNDSIYKDLIIESLDHFKIAGINSLFQEKASTEFNSAQLAVMVCNSKADSTYKSRIKNYDLHDIKDYIFNNHKDSLGISSYDDLELDEFYVSLSLHNPFNINIKIESYQKTFK